MAKRTVDSEYRAFQSRWEAACLRVSGVSEEPEAQGEADVG